MQVQTTEIPGVVIIEPKRFQDERGFFFETFQAKRYQQYGISTHFVQDNFSHSVKNVIRGLHYQIEHAQGKLVFVAVGKVLDVIVDIRLGSPAFGKCITIELSSDNNRQVYVPPGCAHGFCVLSDAASFVYKCTDYYYPQGERGIIWNDSDLGIEWSTSSPLLSPKDAILPRLKDIPQEQLPRFVELVE